MMESGTELRTDGSTARFRFESQAQWTIDEACYTPLSLTSFISRAGKSP